MIRGRSPKAVSALRKAQRAHAKKRFEQRFALQMNRDRIHEIEKRIASGQVILIERRPQIRNYFVGVEGKLIAVGYNTLTKRVVTALPDSYADKLPRDLIHMARFQLLNDATGVIADILSGKNSQLLYRQLKDSSCWISIRMFVNKSYRRFDQANQGLSGDIAKRSPFAKFDSGSRSFGSATRRRGPRFTDMKIHLRRTGDPDVADQAAKCDPRGPRMLDRGLPLQGRIGSYAQ